MSQVIIEGGTIENTFFKNQLRMKVNTEVLAANKTLVLKDNPVQFLDNGGSTRTITLPAEADSEGLMFIIANPSGGANDMTVEDDGSSTVIVLSQAEMGIVICDGVTWLGFVGAAT